MRARWYVTDLSIQFWQRIDDVLRIMQNVSVGKSSGSTSCIFLGMVGDVTS